MTETDALPTTRYAIVAVAVEHDPAGEYPGDLAARCDEVERYLYGRSFRLDVADIADVADRRGRRFARVWWLVEERYAQAIVDRLASGLFWARHASTAERVALGLHDLPPVTVVGGDDREGAEG